MAIAGLAQVGASGQPEIEARASAAAARLPPGPQWHVTRVFDHKGVQAVRLDRAGEWCHVRASDGNVIVWRADAAKQRAVTAWKSNPLVAVAVDTKIHELARQFAQSQFPGFTTRAFQPGERDRIAGPIQTVEFDEHLGTDLVYARVFIEVVRVNDRLQVCSYAAVGRAPRSAPPDLEAQRRRSETAALHTVQASRWQGKPQLTGLLRPSGSIAWTVKGTAIVKGPARRLSVTVDGITGSVVLAPRLGQSPLPAAIGMGAPTLRTGPAKKK